ncbi:N-ethylammeline chlorohydrolase [Paenibacillus yonginensis]|uniref:5-methylthioadenosine/S-adenosylhomocysteine deaminase n=1 Tax=Paenibacillus yonginensis TaxID=1462996 RepID=A0A1B1N634_9BACL|nr:5'-deoxyadenosine deaminase [Paenibacillus yonginensis]ANS76879.1 N-ethylammeline chlorohydrolase [Paenibacillus yonginensis]
MENLLIRNAEIITMNASEDILYGDIWIENGRIAAVGGQLAPEGPYRTLEASGRTVIPGFVQTHIHLCQTLFRGKGDDLELMDWLRNRIWPLEAAHDEESVYYSALLGIGELIASGTTTIVDMETVHHTGSALRAIAESGIRALSGKVMMDRKDSDIPLPLQEDTSASLQESVYLLEQWDGYDDGRIRYAFCPRFVVSCTEPLLKEVRDLSARYKVMVHTHASENRGEIDIVQATTGMRNIVYLDHIGLANERLILAHCIWLDEEEKRILHDRSVRVSHCPGSNLKLASGIAETPDLLAQGISVSLGADGAPCNNNLDMFNEMRLAALIQKPHHGPTVMDARTVFRMATIGGAKAVGMEQEIGSIEVGKQADLAILNLMDFHTFPSYDVDPISRIVYSATRADVETTIIGGKVVMERGLMTTLDKATVLKEANNSIKRLLKRGALA